MNNNLLKVETGFLALTISSIFRSFVFFSIAGNTGERKVPLALFFA